ncbi:hypothetical protein LLE49_08035 [Alicyclobacillus tolerans]|uniref:hypothetical protein n=1 Tax=Alicyclobacillus tolerans TaxID=90970 RepID=UPI001F185D2F|nr:hypothetical protein [Alicyclobacillus tolerans]MCF8564695.1 hypothetical protein [Alicyclobacillus tolerans]
MGFQMSCRKLYKRVCHIINCIENGKSSGDVYEMYVKYQLNRQCNNDKTQLQLPEPANLPLLSSQKCILTVGRNPGFNKTDVVPRYGDKLSKYIQYYEKRLGNRFLDSESIFFGGLKGDNGNLMTHHQFVESNYLKPLGYRYGDNAISIDANPFRSNEPNFGVKNIDGIPEVLHEKVKRVEEYVGLFHPQLILFLGKPAMDIVRMFLPDTEFPIIKPEFVERLGAYIQCVHHPGYPKQETFWYFHRASEEATGVLPSSIISEQHSGIEN